MQLLFADDIVMYHRHPNLAITIPNLQSSIHQFTLQANRLFLSLFPHKSKSVLFPLRLYYPIVVKIRFNEHNFEYLEKFKYKYQNYFGFQINVETPHSIPAKCGILSY